MLEVRLLGRFDVRLAGAPVEIPSRPAQSLFAYLVLSAGTAHRREKLAGLLWPDSGEESARSNLRHTLWRMRKALESAGTPGRYLLTDDLSVSFDSRSDHWLDVAVLERATEDESIDHLTTEVSVFGGELLPGFYDDWVVVERERLQAVFDRKMRRLLDALATQQRWPELLEWGERWVATGNSPEPAYRALMVAHAALGDMSNVASVYQRCTRSLRVELGVDPSEQTRALYERLSRGERPVGVALSTEPARRPSVAEEQTGPAPGESPYKGLQRFDESDAELFFGREELTATVVARLQDERFVAVVGTSGSGKSSLVRAGVVPALKRADGSIRVGGGWTILVLTPGAHPLEALAASLTRDATSVNATSELADDLARDPRSLSLYLRKIRTGRERLLLVIDQFEELFTECERDEERDQFVENVLHAVTTGSDGLVTVIISLRADFYAHCGRHARLRELLGAHQEYIGSMSAHELRRAIEEPARVGGWEFDPGLVEILLRDVGTEPGALPLLSHALLETWSRRRGRMLSLQGYAESGGVRGAIARTADRVLNQQLAAEQRVIARGIFLRLTELGDGTEDTRRRASRRELVARPEGAPAVEAVLRVLADSRLITTGMDTVEVAHEALIREWPTLRGWLNEDREGLRVHRHVTAAALEWQVLGHDPEAIYRGTRLEQALEWARAHGDELNVPERAFLDASRDWTERESAEREARRQRELEAAQRLAEVERQRAEEQVRATGQLRRRALYLTAAFVVSLALAATSLFFGDQARQRAVVAQSNARLAVSRELASAAIRNLDDDPERSVLLALRAIAVTRAVDGTWTAEAEEALHRAVQASRVQLRLSGHTDAVIGVAFSRDGNRIASASVDHTARVWDATTGRQIVTLLGHSDEVNAAVFSPDGSRIATAGDDLVGKVWDASTGKELLTLSGHTSGVSSIGFNSDGSRLATASIDGTAKIWDAKSGRLLLTLAGHSMGIRALALSPDGTRLVTGSLDNTAKVWDLTTGTEVATLRGHSGAVFGVAFSPDGARIATASGDATARIWDAATGRVLLTFDRHAAIVQPVAFSPDGTRIVTGSYDGKAKVWDSSTGKELLTLAGHQTQIFGIAFSPDGKRVATAGGDSTARVWDVTASKELLALSAHAGATQSVAFSPDGRWLLTGGADRQPKMWDATTGAPLHTLAGHSDRVWSVAISPDGRRLATASRDNTVKVWDAGTGKELLTLAGHGDALVSDRFLGVLAVAFSPDGRRLATGAADGTARVWDASTGRELLVLRGHSKRLNGVAFSPDARYLATGGDDTTARLWNAGTGEEIRIFRGHTQRVWIVAFSPDGTRLATNSGDGTAKLWTVADGAEFTVARHTSAVSGLAFSPDGTRVATSGPDGVKLWSAAGGTAPLRLTAEGAPNISVAFSPDGSRLVAAGSDGTARVYALRLGELLALAETRLTRSWTPDECQQLLHLERCPEGP